MHSLHAAHTLLSAPLAPLFSSNSGLETSFLCTNELVSETLPLEDGSTHFLM